MATLPWVTLITDPGFLMRIDWLQFEAGHMREVHTATPGTLNTGNLRNALPPVEITALRAIQTTKLCPKGFEFFVEGESPVGVYIVYAGRVELSITDNQGRKIVTGTALPGDILGLSAVLSGKDHEEAAAAAVPSETGFIKCKDFLRFLGSHPETAFWVVQLLSDQVTTTLEQLSCIRRTPSNSKDIRQ